MREDRIDSDFGSGDYSSYLPNFSAPGAKERFLERRLISKNRKMLHILDLLGRTGRSPSTVFIQGESGTGKELIARFIHETSDRKKGPFVAVNCASLPESLLESEMFGHEKGAFTGAIQRKLGKFELANNGTILLDEISEMPVSLQAKLLRVLQEKEIDRVGGRAPIPLNIRVIATSNQDLKKEVAENRFREDLFYRLNVIPVVVPPLRERLEDLPLLIDYFIGRFNRQMGLKIKGISPDAQALLGQLTWKGNVRELENVLERAVLLSRGPVIERKDLFPFDEVPPKPETTRDARPQEKGGLETGMTISEMEKRLIYRTLEEVDGNRTRAAERLGVSIRTLRNKLNEYKEKRKT